MKEKQQPSTSPSSSSPEEEDYDPFKHRNVLKPTSSLGALAHLLKTSLGTGILAMAMAYKHAGLVGGAVGTVVVGIICTHCIALLVRSSQILCKRLKVPTLSFPSTAEAAFNTGPTKTRCLAKFMKAIFTAPVTAIPFAALMEVSTFYSDRHFITTELLSSFILGNTVYVVFIAESISQVVGYYFCPSINIRLYILGLWIPLIIICQFQNLKSLVPFSVIANLFVLVSFSIVTWYIFKDINPPSSVRYLAPINQIPVFICTVIFAIEGIGTVMSIENEMKHPEQFLDGRCGIIYISMTFVVTIYGIIGFFGYLQYGENTKGSITLNLPAKEPPAVTVKVLIAAAVFLTYALQYYVPINIVWDLIKDRIPEKKHKKYNFLVRAGLVTITIILSLAIPNLEPVISLVGAIVFSTLGLLFPAVIDTVTRWPKMGFWMWRLVKNVFIIMVSLLALTYGSYWSLKNILQEYS